MGVILTPLFTQNKKPEQIKLSPVIVSYSKKNLTVKILKLLMLHQLKLSFYCVLHHKVGKSDRNFKFFALTQIHRDAILSTRIIGDSRINFLQESLKPGSHFS